MTILTNILIFVISCTMPSGLGQKAPKELTGDMYHWSQQIMVHRLINMTAELLHDTTQKIKHAVKIRDIHKTSITFELGTISAGIQERFQRMLKIYRKYGNNKDFLANKYNKKQYLHAYHVLQGDYNEIRLEKSLFHEIKRKHESTMTTTFDFKHAAITFPSAKLPVQSMDRKSRRKWSPPTEEYFFNIPIPGQI